MATQTMPPLHQHLRGRTNAAATGEKHAKNSSPANSNSGHEERFRLIQVCAYDLWEKAGKPNDDGSRERFWLEAEKAITAPCSTDE